MTEGKGGFRRGAGVLCALSWLAATAGNPGCSPEDGAPGQLGPSTAPGGGSATATSGAGAGDATGGAGGADEPSYRITSVAPAMAFDATPDPSGALVYFTAVAPNGRAGVFKVSARGDATVTEIAAGPPFVAPLGIAMGRASHRVFVADPGASGSALGGAGDLFAIDLGNGVVTPVPGGEGWLARGLEIVGDAAGEELILFSGRDPEGGQPGVFRLPARGGQVSAVAKGAPLVDPSGVAVNDEGDLFVCDTLAGPGGTAAIFRIEDGFVSPLVAGLHAGYPCGLALTRDAAALLVLTRSAARRADEVVRIDVATGARSTIVAVAPGHDEPGGLHRAKDADVFALVDHEAQENGAVFLLGP